MIQLLQGFVVREQDELLPLEVFIEEVQAPDSGSCSEKEFFSWSFSCRDVNKMA
jgi:hypothetical protein